MINHLKAFLAEITIAEKSLSILGILGVITALSFGVYSKISDIPGLKNSVLDHEKRIITMESKLDFVVDGMKTLLRRNR